MASDDTDNTTTSDDEKKAKYEAFTAFMDHLEASNAPKPTPEKSFGEKASDMAGDVGDSIVRGVGNTVGKGLEMAQGIGEAAMHPIDTAGAALDNFDRSRNSHSVVDEAFHNAPMVGPLFDMLPDADAKIRTAGNMAGTLVPGGMVAKSAASAGLDFLGHQFAKVTGQTTDGENTDTRGDAEDAISNSLLNLIFHGVGKVAKTTGDVVGGYTEKIPSEVEKVLDPKMALAKAISKDPEEFKSVTDNFGNQTGVPLSDVTHAEQKLLTVQPDESGNVFGPMQKNVEGAHGIERANIDRVQQSAIAASPKMKVKDMDLPGLQNELQNSALPEQSKTRAVNVVTKQIRGMISDHLGDEVLDKMDKAQRVNVRARAQIADLEDAIKKTPTSQTQQLADLQKEKTLWETREKNSFNYIKGVTRKLANTDVSSQRVLDLRREFDSLGQFDKEADPLKRQVAQRAYRGVANRLRGAFNNTIGQSLGPDALVKYKSSSDRLNNLSRLLGHVTDRAAEERMATQGANTLGDIKKGITGDVGSLTPRNLFDLSQGKGTMAGFTAGQNLQSTAANVLGKTVAPAAQYGGRTLKGMATVGAGVMSQLVQGGQLDPATAKQYQTALSTGTDEEQRAAMGKVASLSPTSFPPPPIPGIHSMVDNTVQDDLEIQHLTQMADKAFPTDLRARVELKAALSQRQPLQASQVRALGGIPATVEKNPVDSFIETQEGGQKLQAYTLPKSKGSGVTVGTGFDLGQHSVQDLRNMDIPETLVSKLGKYTGKTGDDARAILRVKPLTLSQEDADALDKASRQQTKERLASSFHATTGTSIDSLPKEGQIVLHSLAYNFGPDLERRLPSVWKSATTGDWAGVQKFLMKSKWKQPELKARRMAEARVLDPLVAAEPDDYRYSGLSSVKHVSLSDGTSRIEPTSGAMT